MNRRPGFSLTELMVALGLLGLLFSFLQIGVRWQSTSLEALEKTDLTAKLRNSSVVLSRLLSQATEFLYPCRVEEKYVYQIVFRNKENDIGTIYLNEKNGLCYFNMGAETSFEIAPFAAGFKTRMVKPNLLEYQISIKKGDFQFFVTNELSAVNTLP